jgi:chromosome segregation ATPase
MPPEILDAVAPLSGGGVAGAIAYAVVKLMEIKAAMPQLRAEVEQLRQGHAQCEARSARLETRIDELLDRLSEPG